MRSYPGQWSGRALRAESPVTPHKRTMSLPVGGALANAAQTRTLIGRDAELDRVEEFLGALDSGPAALLSRARSASASRRSGTRGCAASPLAASASCAAGPASARPRWPTRRSATCSQTCPRRPWPSSRRRSATRSRWRCCAPSPTGEQPLQRAIGLGLLGLLRALAEDAPTLFAIDDAHWLDPPSESALGFVARRLSDERIGLFCVRRGGGGEGAARPRPRAAGGRFERLALGGLDADELDLLLRTAWPAALAPDGCAHPARDRRQPLLRARDRPGPGRAQRPPRARRELPIPPSLQELVRDRLEQLPAPARAAAQVAAALSRPTFAWSTPRSRRPAEPTRPSRPASSSGMGSASSSPTRCSPPSPTSCSRRGAARAACAPRRDPRRPRGARAASRAGHRGARRGRRRRARARGAARCGARRAGGGRRAAEQAGALTPAGADDERRRRGIEAAERYFEAGEVAPRATARGDRRRGAARRRAAPRRSPASAGSARTRRASTRAPTSSSPRSPSRPTTSACASRSSPAWPGACTRTRTVPSAAEHAHVPRSSWPRSSAIPPCSRARSR